MALERPTKEGDSPVSKNFQSLVLDVARLCEPPRTVADWTRTNADKLKLSASVCVKSALVSGDEQR